MQIPVSLIHFSPTGNSRTVAQTMAAAIGEVKDTLDLTMEAEPEKICAAEDFVIVAAPVYGGRVPQVAMERLARVRGTQTPCIVAVTFGNRDYDDALLELADWAAAHGFVVKGACAVVGRHTFGEIATTRPDSADLAQCEDFARRALAGAPLALETISGNRPYKEGGKGGKFRPTTTEACTHCGLCVRSCPVQAIAGDCCTIADTCISCFRCIRSCPVQAKECVSEDYKAFAPMFTQKLAAPQENKFFLQSPE